MTPPLLSCQDVRIDEDGVPLIEGLSCDATQARVVLVGHWTGLFRALSRSARVARGTARIHGRDLSEAVTSGTVGLTPFEARAPKGFTALEYLSRGAELLGVRVRAARRLAESALEHTGLTALSRQMLYRLPEPERRSVFIANALVGSPPVLALDRPLARLDEEPASFVRSVLERAAENRSLLVSMEPPPPEGPERRFLDAAQEALALYADGTVARLDPTSRARAGKRYVIVAAHRSLAFAEALAARGVEIEPSLPTDGESRLVLRLPAEATTDLVLRVAVELSVPLLGMFPLDAMEAAARPGGESVP